MKFGAFSAVVFVGVGVGSAARADGLMQTTPRAMALAGAYTALSDDAAALFFNPAGLSSVDGSSAALEFAFAFPRLTAGPTGGDRRKLETPRDDGYGLYLAWSPDKFLDGGLGLGFSVVLPHRRAVHFNIHPVDEPYFVLFENSIELLELRIGASYRFLDFVSVGGSVLLLAGLDGDVAIDAPFQNVANLDPSKRTTLELSAILPNKEFFSAGVLVGPWEGFTFGLTYRESTFVRVRLPIDFNPQIGELALPTIATLDVKVKYTPPQLAFGAAYRYSPSLLFVADLTWAQYSEYELPYGDVSLDLSDLAMDLALLPPRRPVAELTDVFVPRIGAEWAIDPALVVRGGYYYLASFINSVDLPILDSDKHNFALGASYRIDPLILGETESKVVWTVSAAGQLLWHVKRATAGFDHAGVVFATSFGTEILY